MPTSNSPKAVLFDFDGTLIDTESTWVEITETVCAQFNIPLEPGEVKTRIGVSNAEWYAQLLKKKHLDQNLLRSILDVQFGYYEKAFPTVPFCPGVPDILFDLLNSKILIGLVTSSKRRYVDAALKRLNFQNRFDVEVTYEDVIVDGIPKKKPDPFPYTLALKRLNETRLSRTDQPILPNEVGVVEDGGFGIESGKAANMHVIGVVNAGISDISSSPEVDLVVNTLADLRNIRLDEWLKKSLP